jgi:hypothetical protein
LIEEVVGTCVGTRWSLKWEGTACGHCCGWDVEGSGTAEVGHGEAQRSLFGTRVVIRAQQMGAYPGHDTRPKQVVDVIPQGRGARFWGMVPLLLFVMGSSVEWSVPPLHYSDHSRHDVRVLTVP